MLYLARSGGWSGAHLREQEHLFTALQAASSPYQKPHHTWNFTAANSYQHRGKNSRNALLQAQHTALLSAGQNLYKSASILQFNLYNPILWTSADQEQSFAASILNHAAAAEL